MVRCPVNKVRPPRRGIFFKRLGTFLNKDQLAIVGRAYEFSKYGHYKQRRDDGTRYFDHPKMVAWILIDEIGITDWVTLIIAILHDLWEDQFMMSYQCFKECFSLDIAEGVDAVTKRRKPRKEGIRSYIARVIAYGWRAVIVKLADRLHNMRTLNNCPPEKQVRVAKQTLRYYIPLCQTLRQMMPCDSRAADYFEAELRKECARYV